MEAATVEVGLRSRRVDRFEPLTVSGLPPEVEPFLTAPCRVAVAGMLADPQSVEFVRAERLLAYGFQLFPVHSHCGELLGHSCYAHLTEVPGPVDLLLVLPTNQVPQRDLAAEAIGKQVKVFWVEEAPLDRAVAARLAGCGIAAVEERSLQVEVALRRC